MRRPFQFAALAAAAVLAASCTDSSSAPAAVRSGKITLSTSFSPSASTAYRALAQFGLDITNVHLRLTAPDGSARDSTIAFPSTMDVLQIDVAVPIGTTGQSFTADVELRNANDVVLFSGRQIVIAQSSGFPGTPSPIVIDYTGPGRDVKAIALTPRGATLIGATTLPFVAAAVDAAGAPVPSFLVAWSISDTSLAKVAESGATGAVVTSAGKRGVVTLSAKTPLGIIGSTPLALVPAAARLVVVSGAGQSGPAGRVVANPLVVEVQASDNLPVPGAPVTFRAVTAGGSVGTATVVADANGRASSTLAVGKAIGPYQFEAASGALAPVTATAIATPAPPAALTAISGSGQVVSVGAGLAQPFVVKVTDEFGSAVAGVTVNWARVSGSGILASPTSTTAQDGTASMAYTFGTTAGTEIIRASLATSGGGSVDFTVRATSGAPASVVGTGTGQHAPVGAALPAPIAVQVLDAFGNPVLGATVTWRVSSTSTTTATFSPAVSTTDASGSATTVVTLGGATGPLTVTAQVNGLSTTFQLTADPPPPPPDAVRIVLTWGATPADLDSYLSGPQQNTTARFFIGYQYGPVPPLTPRPACIRGSLTASPFACLDVDNTDGFGPETMTISQVLPGTYRYTVHNYSQETPLGQSGARVDVYLNGILAQSFSVPSGTGIYWTVFELNGATITPVNTVGNGPLTTRIPVGTGLSASRISAPTTVFTGRSDNDLIAEYVRQHPKAAGATNP